MSNAFNVPMIESRLTERAHSGLWSAPICRTKKAGTQPLSLTIDALYTERRQLQSVLNQALALLALQRLELVQLNEGGAGPAPCWQERWRTAVLALVSLRNALRYTLMSEPAFAVIDPAEMTDEAAVVAADNAEVRQRFSALRRILAVHDAAILAALDGAADHATLWSGKHDQVLGVLDGLVQRVEAALQG